LDELLKLLKFLNVLLQFKIIKHKVIIQQPLANEFLLLKPILKYLIKIHFLRIVVHELEVMVRLGLLRVVGNKLVFRRLLKGNQCTLVRVLPLNKKIKMFM